MSKDQEFQKIWDEAVTAGRTAGENETPIPMVVSGGYAPVLDGVCGFAWVSVKPATSAFAKWLKKNELARRDSYEGGLRISVFEYNQSMGRKQAHATAMAEVLRSYGFSAYAGSRMD